MIAGISKLITLHLAPLLSIVSIILLYIAYFAPVTSLHTEVSLMSITPAITLVALNARSHIAIADEQDLRVLFNGRVVPRAAIAERALAARASRPVDGPSVFMGLLGEHPTSLRLSTRELTFYVRLLRTNLQLRANYLHWRVHQAHLRPLRPTRKPPSLPL